MLHNLCVVTVKNVKIGVYLPMLSMLSPKLKRASVFGTPCRLLIKTLHKMCGLI